MPQLTLALASDHAGFEYKEAINSHLTNKGFQVLDFGAHSSEPVDYPAFVKAATLAVKQGKCHGGIISVLSQKFA